VTERFTDSWINLVVTGLPLKRHSAMGRCNGSSIKIGKEARDKSKKFDIAPELMSADTVLGRPRI